MQPLAVALEIPVADIINGERARPNEIVEKTEMALLKAVDSARKAENFFQDWGWAVALVAIVLFVAVGFAYNAVVGEQTAELPPIGTMMDESYHTVCEKKNGDGSITAYYITGDPLFWGAYPYRNVDEEGVEVEPRDDWKYRITYTYASNVEPIVFEFGDWYEKEIGFYFVQNGKAHSMTNITLFMYQIEAVFAYCEVHNIYPGATGG